MEIQFYGANCVRLTTKKASIVVDDNLASLGQKSASKAGDIILQTYEMPAPTVDSKIVIGIPGEYEVLNVSIQGVAARAHMDQDDKQTATMFKVIADDLKVVIAGHVYPDLSDDQLEALGSVDVLIVPVGGNGYTLDGIGALKLIRKIEPKLVIPTHYDDTSLKFEVPQQPLDEAIKALAMEVKETVPKLKLKIGELGETTQLVILEKQ